MHNIYFSNEIILYRSSFINVNPYVVLNTAGDTVTEDEHPPDLLNIHST